MDAIEVDEFALLMKQLKYDKAAHATWKRKCSTTMEQGSTQNRR